MRHTFKIFILFILMLFLNFGLFFIYVVNANAETGECNNESTINTCINSCQATENTCEFFCSSECYTECAAKAGWCEVQIPFKCPLPWDYGDCQDRCNDAWDNCLDACDDRCDACLIDCRGSCDFDCKEVGQSCNPVDPGFGQQCAEGLNCVATLGANGNAFTCFPNESDDLYDEATCLKFYSKDLHEFSISKGKVMSYGSGFGGAYIPGFAFSQEIGVVYAPDGRYGCYKTDCYGGTSDWEITGGSFCWGIYNPPLENFEGQSEVFIGEGGEIAVLSSLHITNIFTGEYLGTSTCVSFELSFFPASVSALGCMTIVDTVGVLDSNGDLITSPAATNDPPLANCKDMEVCADPFTCNAYANVDNGSYDPENNIAALVQNPPGPYPIGNNNVTLLISDQYSAVDSCVANVKVNDCSPPAITCPPPLTTECTGDYHAAYVPGPASATDNCTPVSVINPSEISYPLGENPVTYTAVDAGNNIASCDTAITVVDTTPPAIICPPPAEYECTGNNQASADPGEAAAEDICSDITMTDPEPAVFPLGETIITYSAVDAFDNSSSCSSSISVVDTTPPDITCPPPSIIECTDNSQAVADPGAADAGDICSDVTVNNPGSASYPLGETPVTYTAVDGSNNSTSCTSSVTVLDTTPPEISCNMHEIDPFDRHVSFKATASDACGDADVEILDYDCFKETHRGKRISMEHFCKVEVNGDTIKIHRPGGVGTTISWTVMSTDASGNITEGTCELEVQRPGLIKRAIKKIIRGTSSYCHKHNCGIFRPFVNWLSKNNAKKH